MLIAAFVLSGLYPSFAEDSPVDPRDAIWIEGEHPTKSDVARHPWWYDKVKKDVLSGGDWISNFSKEKEGVAEYELEAIVADTYAFWIRANPLGAKLSYQLDGSARARPHSIGAVVVQPSSVHSRMARRVT